ncbi:hypothetical protein PAMP_012030 [Pampus punctatissimus]
MSQLTLQAASLARLLLQLKIISLLMLFGFHVPLYNLFPFSIMVASVDVSSAIDSCEPLEMGEVRMDEDSTGIDRVNPVMQKPDPAGHFCDAAYRNKINTSVHRVFT